MQQKETSALFAGGKPHLSFCMEEASLMAPVLSSLLRCLSLLHPGFQQRASGASAESSNWGPCPIPLSHLLL